MGQMYHERGEYSPALSALNKALEFVNKDGDNAYAESNVQNTLASVYAESEDSLDSPRTTAARTWNNSKNS